MKRKVVMTEEYSRFHETLDPMTRKGVNRKLRDLECDADREGYPVVSQPGRKSVHVNDVDPIRWGHGFRLIVGICGAIVRIFDGGDHRHSALHGHRGVYDEDHRKHRR